jgi:hypothetical protein
VLLLESYLAYSHGIARTGEEPSSG